MVIITEAIEHNIGRPLALGNGDADGHAGNNGQSDRDADQHQVFQSQRDHLVEVLQQEVKGIQTASLFLIIRINHAADGPSLTALVRYTVIAEMLTYMQEITEVAG